jgi:hypothetical protein
MNSIKSGLEMRKAGDRGGAGQPENPHSNAIFTQVHNTLYSVLAWKNSYWGIAARVHYTLVTVAAVAFVWFLNYWNLLGWRF